MSCPRPNVSPDWRLSSSALFSFAFLAAVENNSVHDPPYALNERKTCELLNALGIIPSVWRDVIDKSGNDATGGFGTIPQVLSLDPT